MKTLQGCKTDGRTSVSNGMNELIDAGYIEKEQLRNEKGQLDGIRYIIYMKPQKPDDTKVSPESRKPDYGKREVGKPTTNNTISKKKIYNI